MAAGVRQRSRPVVEVLPSKSAGGKPTRTRRAPRNKRRSHKSLVDRNLETLAMERVPTPPPLTTDQARHLMDEQQVYRTEQLMVKGVRRVATLQGALGVKDQRMMRKYMERVKARWAVQGGATDLRQARGEALVRLDMLETKLWHIIQITKDYREQIVALKEVGKIHEYRTEMLGLTPEMAATLATSSVENDVLVRSAKQARLAGVAKKFIKALQSHDDDVIDITQEAVAI